MLYNIQIQNFTILVNVSGPLKYDSLKLIVLNVLLISLSVIQYAKRFIVELKGNYNCSQMDVYCQRECN